MFYIQKKRPFQVFLYTLLIILIWSSSKLSLLAVDYKEEALLRKELPVESNLIDGWPKGPLIGADAAILMEANTGTILYAKSISKKSYPASTTKLLTTLLALENSSLDEIVTFSHDAVFSIPWDASGMGSDVNEQITMEQALYAVLVGSANDAANAVAEHISGSMDDFAALMTERAAQLGCKNSNFVNSNGLYDDNHYTTAYDLALIAQEFFQYELLRKMSSTPLYNIPVSPTQPDDIWLRSHHKLLPEKEYSYDYFIGGKTGYTDKARQTLVSCAEKDGLRLICVILKEESPDQFTDTISLFDYGFSNFKIYDVATYENEFNISHSDFFNSGIEVFGNSSPMLHMDQSAKIVLPINATFEDATSSLSYHDEYDSSVATVNYQYLGVDVGSASINLREDLINSLEFFPNDESNDKEQVEYINPTITNGDAPTSTNVVFINVKNIVFSILGVTIFVIVIFVVIAFIRNYHFSRKRRSKLRRKRRRAIPSPYDDIDF